ncbi:MULTISPECIES: CU044_5270 family protein [Nocardiopsidaceae]|uniref:CU044_5270 family protein n=2 Tax=Nocardiopsidaceae TaxID=83676 RepID=A0ABY6YIZ8_9ACTN|nr:CU044_5270 family protein [Streptomonospora nanhaiensis]MEE2045560.1 CU044_5270 family protein [Nocardiopsis tropica]WAE72208.1 CU044_5270 family protein [Streptomonospora nanhaiensis]
MDDVTALRALLNDSDPRAGATASFPDRQRARTKAIAMLDAAPARRPLWRRIPVLAGAATLVAATTAAALVVGAAGGGPAGIPSAYAAPPDPIEVTGGAPEPGAERLLDLADTAAEGDDAPGDGDVAHVSSTGQELLTVTSFAGEEPSEDDLHSVGFIPYDWQYWQGPGGDMREISTAGEAEDTRGDVEEHREFLDDRSDDFESTMDESLVLPRDLPTDADILAQTLLEWGNDDVPADSPEADGALVNALNHLYENRPLDADERAAALRVLSGFDGVEYAGSTQDPLARDGELFQIRIDEGSQTNEYRYVFDSESGALLYRDVTLLEEEPGESSLAQHGLELPVTVSYRTFVWSGWVNGIGDRP